MIDIKLTDEEKAKYDDIYAKITSNYSKEDMQTLEEDEVAKYFLKNIIIKYIFTGEFPKDFSNTVKASISGQNEYHYDAKIPLQEEKEELIKLEQAQAQDVEIISNNTIEDTGINEFIEPIQNQ